MHRTTHASRAYRIVLVDSEYMYDTIRVPPRGARAAGVPVVRCLYLRLGMYKAWKAAPARCRKALWSPKSGKTYRYRYLVSLNLEILPYSRTYPGMVLAALPRPRVDTW